MRCLALPALSRAQPPPDQVHRVDYKGRMDAADTFFAQPWLMEVPAAVHGTCWDVILVDAPRGYAPGHPGERTMRPWVVLGAAR